MLALTCKMFIATAYSIINVFTSELFLIKRCYCVGYSAVINNISSMSAPNAVTPLVTVLNYATDAVYAPSTSVTNNI